MDYAPEMALFVPPPRIAVLEDRDMLEDILQAGANGEPIPLTAPSP